jgi:hypothetical protein
MMKKKMIFGCKVHWINDLIVEQQPIRKRSYKEISVTGVETLMKNKDF